MASRTLQKLFRNHARLNLRLSTNTVSKKEYYGLVSYNYCFQERNRSSYHSKCFYTNTSQLLCENQQKLSKLEAKLYFEYTCNVCEQRSNKIINKQAYESGVVLVRCDSCNNLHLIADNLGWFRDKKVNIEDLMKEKGETITRVSMDNLQFVSKS